MPTPVPRRPPACRARSVRRHAARAPAPPGPSSTSRSPAQPMVAHTLAALARGAAARRWMLVVLAPDDDEFVRRACRRSARSRSRAAAARRARATVATGLRRAGRRAARAPTTGCWCTTPRAAWSAPTWIDALIDACRDDAVGGLLALPVADTLKRERDGRVAATLDRATTSGRRRRRRCSASACSRDALARAGDDVTDEAERDRGASAWRRCWCPARRRISRSPSPDDFALAEAHCSQAQAHA